MNGTLYVVTPFPEQPDRHRIFRKPGGALKFGMSRIPIPRAVGLACCDTVNRGAPGNGQSSTTCSTRQRSPSTRRRHGILAGALGTSTSASDTMAATVVKDKVLVGSSGGELGVRGWLAALDVKSGKEVWRAYQTGPDKQSLWAPSSMPSQGGRATTSGSRPGWRSNGGAAAGTSGAGSPMTLQLEPRSTTARATRACGTPTCVPATTSGRARSSRATRTTGTPCGPTRSSRTTITTTTNHGERPRRHGLGFHQAAQGPAASRPQRLHVRARPRDGRAALGREVRALHQLGARLRSEDSGLPLEEKSKQTASGRIVEDICPSSTGGKEFIPSAFSPRTGLLYIPAPQHLHELRPSPRITSRARPTSAHVRMHPGSGGYQGEPWRGIRAREEGLGVSGRTSCPFTAGSWRRRATSSFTRRWTDTSARYARSGTQPMTSTWARGSSATR